MRGIEERRHNAHLDMLLASRLAQSGEASAVGPEDLARAQRTMLIKYGQAHTKQS